MAVVDRLMVIRFDGDVRLSLCTTLDDLIDRLLVGSEHQGVLIDLTPAHNIDSTCLGLIAKLGIESQQRYGKAPTLVCPVGDVFSQVDGLGVLDLFDHHARFDLGSVPVRPLEPVDCADSAARPLVLQAHQVLMGLNEQNQILFTDLVKALDEPS